MMMLIPTTMKPNAPKAMATATTNWNVDSGMPMSVPGMVGNLLESPADGVGTLRCVGSHVDLCTDLVGTVNDPERLHVVVDCSRWIDAYDAVRLTTCDFLGNGHDLFVCHSS